MLLQLLANGLVNGCLYALVALSFALIYNTTRIFHLAHGAVYVAAAYLAWWLYVRIQWPMGPSLIVAIGGAAALGALTELAVYYPLARRGAPSLVMLLSSLGLYVVLVNLIALVCGNDTKVLMPGAAQTYHFASVIVTRIQVAEVAASVLILPGFVLLLKMTRWGKSIRAVRDNPTLARVLGANLRAVRFQVFLASSAIVGLSGVLVALDVGMEPTAGMSAVLTAAVALIVGGVGTFEGPIIGAFLLGVLQSIVILWTSARWSDAITFAVLIFFLILRPQGLVGTRRRLEEAWD